MLRPEDDTGKEMQRNGLRPRTRVRRGMDREGLANGHEERDRDNGVRDHAGNRDRRFPEHVLLDVHGAIPAIGVRRILRRRVRRVPRRQIVHARELQRAHAEETSEEKGREDGGSGEHY